MFNYTIAFLLKLKDTLLNGGQMKKIFWFLAVIAIAATSVFAQLTSSTLSGTVSGPDGLLPGATVVVKDNQTGKEVTVTTNSEGGFKVPNLEVGTYSVTVTATGFKTYTANGVKLEVGKDFSLPVALELGNVSEVVTVTAGAEIVNSVDAKISNSVSRKTLDDLPSLGRNPLNFVPLQAGAASNPNQGTVINGIRTSGTNTTIDGINVQDNFIRSNATDFSPARPTVDEVEEFAVSTQNGADDGFGGAQIQFSTRRGGNEYHVRLFEFNRNSKLAANNFFSNSSGTPRPFRNRNQFGGNVLGPLPFFNFGEGGPFGFSGKDKLFFFFAYEKLIDRQPADPQFSTVLTNNARQGIFTYLDAGDSDGNGSPDRDPQIQTVNLFNPAFNTGITAINPIIASRFLGRIPIGNSTQRGDQRNTTGFVVQQVFNPEQTNYTGRIDYIVNGRNQVTGTYRSVDQTLLRADIDNSFNQIPDVVQPSSNPFLSLGLTSSITSNFTNELRGGFFFSDPFFSRTVPNPTNFVTIPLVTNPENPFQNQGRNVKTYNFQDNATAVFGNHSLRFGGQVQSVSIDAVNDVGTVGTFTLGTNTNTPQISTDQFVNIGLFPGGVPTAQRGAANSLVALLGGIVSAGSQGFNVESQTSGFVSGATQRRQFNYKAYGFSVADQWRATSDLTINIGLRYDLYTALRSDNGLALEPVITDINNPLPSLLNPLGTYQFVGGNIGKPGQFYNTDRNNFSPVVSFAYAPSFSSGIGRALFGEKRTVLRGGYRTSYINDELVRAPDNALLGNQGLALTVNAFNPVANTTALNARIGSLPIIPAPVFGGPNRTFLQNNLAAGFFGTVFAVDPNIQSPRVQEYSFGIQREVGFNTAVEIRYVGTRSNNLLRGIDFNQIDIRSNGFLADFNRARSNLLINQAERQTRINALVAGGATLTAATATVNAALPSSAAFNPALAGSVALTVFPLLAANAANGVGLIGTAPGLGQRPINATVSANLIGGTPADLALVYQTGNNQGSVRFLPNPNTGVVDLLTNGAEFNYNALQVDVRRRFSQGLSLNANYTFSKNLTDAVGTGQTRFEPLLDLENPRLDYSRADFDQTHKFNLLTSYELPFGQGRPYLNQGILSTLLGNFQIGAILQIGSGSPLTITDVRGTLNRAGRSGRQTALTSLSTAELRSLVGVYRTPNGVFFLPPEVLGRNSDGTFNSAIGGTGRGANGFGSPTFQGQRFFNNAPGTTSNLGRALFDGPTRYNLDLSFIKRFVFREKYSIQIQGDLFNTLNTANFFTNSQFSDVNSPDFGRLDNVADARVVQLAFRLNF